MTTMHEGQSSGRGFVYAVHDGTGAVVYVGQTIVNVATRYRQHLREALDGSTLPFHIWLRYQIEDGNVPRVSTIERPPAAQLDERERWWIRHHAGQRGAELLNVAARDDGKPGKPARGPAAMRLRELYRQVVATLPDGPLFAHELQRAADDTFWSSGDLGKRVAQEVLVDAGFLRRRTCYYVRAGTFAATLSDPALPVIERVCLWLGARAVVRGVQPGHVANTVIADSADIAAALGELGFVRGPGYWRPPAGTTPAQIGGAR